jgi:hypothetical protein
LPEDPKSFSDFFSGAISRIKESIKIQRSKKEEPIELVIARLQSVVARGDRAREFLSSNLWANDIEPFLKAEAAKCHWKPWRPGDPILEHQVWAEHLYNSGRAAAYTRIIEEFRVRIEEGRAAAERLKFEMEKKNYVQHR